MRQKKQVIQKILALFLAILIIGFAPIQDYAAAIHSGEVETGGSAEASETASGLFVAQAEGKNPPDNSEADVVSYATYFDNYYGIQNAKNDQTMDIRQAVDKSGAPFVSLEELDGVTVAVLQAGESITFPVSVSTGGLYSVGFDYRMLGMRGREIICSVLIDGALPFVEADRFTLNRLWKDDLSGAKANVEDGDEGYFEKDDLKDEIIPIQAEESGWQTARLFLSDALSDEPVRFFFSKGDHTITITLDGDDFHMMNPCLYGLSRRSYEDYINELADSAIKSANNRRYVKIEAERSALKSSNGLAPYADRSSVDVTPSNTRYITINAIGGYRWREQNQWISWNVDVPADGFYTVTFHYMQTEKRGMASIRALYIDEKLWFDEMANIPFDYGSGWQTTTFSDSDGTAYKLYLEAGEHTLKMEVRLGEAAPILASLSQSIGLMNNIYQKIITITSTNPDLNRDYYLDSEIPELTLDFIAIRDRLKEQIEQLYALSGNKGSEASYIQILIDLLDVFIGDAREIPNRLTNFKSSITALADIVLRMTEQPLSLDYILLASDGMDIPIEKAGFFANFMFRLRLFFYSFIIDYTSLGTANSEIQSVIKVWVSQNDLAKAGTGTSVGREQAQLLHRMIRSQFTPKTGVFAEVSLISSGEALYQSIVAGTSPDVVMFINKAVPVMLAVRGAAEELSQYKGFDSLRQRFSPSALKAFNFQGNTYAVADTQVFYVMYYRTDILKEMGIGVPQTWGEFYSLIKKLHSHDLQVGIPSELGIFEMMLLQHGANLYNEDLSAAALTEIDAIDAFTEWTELYTKYGLNLAFDFISRFRSGEMPVGIMSLNTYNQLTASAPEIKGLWDIAPIPGILDSNQNILRRQSCSVTGTMILKNARYKEDCFRFLDWWTLAETQSRYGIETESALGVSGRYFTANQEAFFSLPWKASEVEVLKSQWTDVDDFAQTPASYFVSRCITNAFRNVTYYGRNPREIMMKYTTQINEELRRKRDEFGLNEKVTEG